ncbi:MAG: NAD-dependent succinate-semialdehyde dehydrogenase [bacterium]
MAIQSKNPYSNKILADFPEETSETIFMKITKANKAFLSWRSVKLSERIEKIQQLAEVLRKNQEQYARIIVAEMGKPITQAMAEIEKCAWVCDYYVQNAPKFMTPEIVKTEAVEAKMVIEPLGVILAIMPWNFPFWQAIRMMVPTLLVGNTVTLKHASNVPQAALAIESAFVEAGFPAGVLQTLLISSKKVEAVINHPLVRAISLTGSETAGKIVAAQAGSQLKKTLMELGGNDPFIILEDADVDKAAKVGCNMRLHNAGQICNSPKRMIVVKSRLEQFTNELLREIKLKRVGNPEEKETEIGPLASEEAVAIVAKQVEASVKLGAKILFGGKVGDRSTVYLPTIITGVKKGMPCYDEEVFGPVCAVISAEDNEDAIRIANDSEFGLSASLWTNNLELVNKYVSELYVGLVVVNDKASSDPRLSFGGVKKSGYGRELSQYALYEFANIKAVVVN